MTPPSDADNIVALSHYRAQLSRGQRLRRADALFASENPAAAIAALPPDEFFYVIHELGFPEALEIIVHGTGEQIQCTLDFAVWDKDTLSIEKANEWLGILMEAPVEAIGAWAKALDIELLALLIRKRARIYDLNLEEAPDQPEGVLWDSPDRFFTLDILGGPDEVRVTQHLIDSLYRNSPGMARRLLVGTRSELESQLEELALRWRNGRMADLGFVSFEEAMQIYRPIDPSTIKLTNTSSGPVMPPQESSTGDSLRLPARMADRMGAKTPFARGMARLNDTARLADAHGALVTLCNRVLSADRVSPADDDAAGRTLERVAATLDLGTEFLARGDEDKEGQAVRSVPITTLFQLGHTLILKARQLALALVQKTPFAVLRPHVIIFDRDDQEILAHIAQLRPTFPCLLANPPTTGSRPFATLADLAIATIALEQIGAKVELLLAMGIRPEHLSPERLGLLTPPVDPATVEAGALARTVLVRQLLGLPTQPIEPLPHDTTQQFKKNFIIDNQLSDIASNNAHSFFDSLVPSKKLTPAQVVVADQWIASLSPLHSLLGSEKV